MADKVFELLYCRHVGFRRPFFPFSRDAVLVLLICRVVGPECADTVVGNAAQRRQYHAVGQRLQVFDLRLLGVGYGEWRRVVAGTGMVCSCGIWLAMRWWTMVEGMVGAGVVENATSEGLREKDGERARRCRLQGR
jgi:hypothetical protein